MLQTKAVSKKMAGFESLFKLYKTAFPKSEQAPMGLLLRNPGKQNVQFHAYYDGETFVGFTYTIIYQDMAYIWYLATVPSLRSKGYGSQILDAIKEANKNNTIVLNMTAKNGDPAHDAVCEKRKAFYERNGFRLDGRVVSISGNREDIMYQNGDFNFQQYQQLFKKFLGPLPNFFIGPKLLKERK